MELLEIWMAVVGRNYDAKAGWSGLIQRENLGGRRDRDGRDKREKRKKGRERRKEKNESF